MSSGKAAEDRSACTPCRGTGQLISSLGGEPHRVTCPWCGGSGRFEAGRDAQQVPAEPGSGGQAEGPTQVDQAGE
jgi:DnaJ-class molecular chaperone